MMPNSRAMKQDSVAVELLRGAAEDGERLRKQLARANKIIGWMMPYIGSMCPPETGLLDLNEHCCDNHISPRMDDETKGPSIRQHAAGARPSGILLPAKEFKLTAQQIAGLVRVRDGGPMAWCHGYGRAGGAVSRMFDRLAKAGLVTRAPHKITNLGRAAIKDR